MSDDEQCPAKDFTQAVAWVVKQYEKKHSRDAVKLTASANGKEIHVQSIGPQPPTLVRFSGTDQEGNFCEILTHVNAAQVVLTVSPDAGKKQIKML